jgi:hypothetical protein
LESDLRDIIAFYRTPTGQKVIKLEPEMALEAMTAFSEKLMPKFQEFFKETYDAEMTLMKEKLQKDSGKKPVRKS